MYSALRAWHAKYPTLQMLLFPSDEFGEQELPCAEVPAFVAQYLAVDHERVQLMDKVCVNGKDEDPVWTLAKQSFPGDVEWNFDALFLIDKEGVPVGRYTASQLRRLEADLAFLCEE